MILESVPGKPLRSGLRCRVPCKLNLFLDVLGRRPDGYHDLDTVMLAVDRCDALEIEARPDGRLTLAVELPDEPAFGPQDPAWTIPNDASNLVLQGLARLRSQLGISAGAHVRLKKQIPAQAGLGGGSADTAAALVLGSLLWTQAYDAALAISIAKELGSDINFFLEGWNGSHWTARCTGRGERVEPIPNPHRHTFVVVHPPQGCSTAAVFRAWSEGNRTRTPPQEPTAPQRIERLMEGLRRGDRIAVGAMLYNCLEVAAGRCTDWVERSARRFDRYNPLGQCLTGSGSARFCLCSTSEEAEKIASELRSFRDYRVYTASTWVSQSIEEQSEYLRSGS